ncbi:hypothetical protein OAA86_07980 [Rhodospirillales bacterium]|nr:hypothetical protein [Rhodospirillales bacterium]
MIRGFPSNVIRSFIFVALALTVSACASSEGDERFLTAEQIKKQDIETCPVNRWQLNLDLRKRMEDPSQDGLVSAISLGEVGFLLNEVVRDGSASARAKEFATDARRYFEEKDLAVRIAFGSSAAGKIPRRGSIKTRTLHAIAAELNARKKIASEINITIDANETSISSGSRTSVSEASRTQSAQILMGATEIASFESWKNDDYQVASVIAWSPGMELNTRATLLGCAKSFESIRSNITIDNLYSDFTGLPQGARILIDNNGRVIFLATGIYPVSASAAQLELSQKLSENIATANLLTGILGPIYAVSSSQISGSFEDNGSVYLANKLDRGVHALIEGVRLPGVRTLKEKVIQDPFSGETYFITLVGLAPDSSETVRNAVSKLLETRVAKGKRLLESPPTYLDTFSMSQ